MKGDLLASGGSRAVFPSLSHVSDSKWEQAFGKPESKPVKGSADKKRKAAQRKKGKKE